MFAVQKYEALNQLPVGLSQQILPKIIKEFQVLNGKFFFAKSVDLNFDTRSKIEEISYHMLNFALNFGYPRAKRDDMFGNFCEKILPTQELINKCRKLEYLQLLNGKLLDGVSPSSLYILGTIYSLVKPSSATPTDLKKLEEAQITLERNLRFASVFTQIMQQRQIISNSAISIQDYNNMMLIGFYYASIQDKVNDSEASKKWKIEKMTQLALELQEKIDKNGIKIFGQILDHYDIVDFIK